MRIKWINDISCWKPWGARLYLRSILPAKFVIRAGRFTGSMTEREKREPKGTFFHHSRLFGHVRAPSVNYFRWNHFKFSSFWRLFLLFNFLFFFLFLLVKFSSFWRLFLLFNSFFFKSNLQIFIILAPFLLQLFFCQIFKFLSICRLFYFSTFFLVNFSNFHHFGAFFTFQL